MSRLLGLVLAVIFLVVAQPAQAQLPASTYGGFGLEYTQAIPANGYVLDRWWWVQATPVVSSTTLPPQTVTEQPAVVQPATPRRVTRAGRVIRSFSRPATRSDNRAGMPAATPLPTGSLYWPATTGLPLYSPAQRYASYGQGYGLSPYGSTDYGAQYKGLYWGY
jgi:hypothetical protein